MNLSTKDNPLIGIWKLVSVTAILPNGKIEPKAFGTNPTGYITYTPEGKMMVIFSRSDRPPLSGNARSTLSKAIHSVPVEERAEAFTTFNAYAGTYTINENTVTHHVEVASMPNRIGQNLTRIFTLDGNRIKLKTPPSKSDDVPKIFELVWEHVEIE